MSGFLESAQELFRRLHVDEKFPKLRYLNLPSLAALDLEQKQQTKFN